MKVTIKKVYLIVWMFMTMGGVWSLIKTHGSILDKYIFSCGNDRFMDFFNHIEYTHNLSNVYNVTCHANHPPLYYLFCHLLHQILPEGAIINFNALGTHSYALLLYCICLCLCVALFCKASTLVYSNAFVIVITLLCSDAFVWVVERGNIQILMVTTCILFALYLRNMGRVEKECALLLFAIAGNIKIYPFIFGLLYLKEKRFSEAIRLAFYGIIVFIVPLALIGNPLDNIKQMVLNLQEITQSPQVGFQNFRALALQMGLSLEQASEIKWLFLIISVVVFWKTNKKWQELSVLVDLMILFPTWSGSYTKFYMCIPLLWFIKSEVLSGFNIIIAIIFAGCFGFFMIDIAVFDDMLGYFILYVGIWVIYIGVCIDVFYNTIKSKSKKNGVAAR